MEKHKFKNRNLLWPNKCAACGKAATHEIGSECSVVTKVGYFVLFFRTTHRVVSISYPVCAKHRLIGAIAAKLSERNLINLGLGVMACFFICGICVALYQSIILGEISVSTGFLMFGIMYNLTYFGLYYWSKHNTPVKINNVTEDEIELSFSNDQYSKEFINLNEEVHS
jgi:hypothetical protein